MLKRTETSKPTNGNEYDSFSIPRISSPFHMPDPGDPRKNANVTRPFVCLNLDVFSKAFESYVERNSLSPLEAIQALGRESLTSTRTLKNWVASSERGTPIRVTTKRASSVGRALGLDDEALFQPPESLDCPTSSEVFATKPWIRTITGRWLIEGGDTSVEPHLTFAQQARTVRGHIDIKQEADGSILAEGLDHDHDKIVLEGQLIGEGSYVRGVYSLHNPRLLVSGVFMLRVQENGREMTGALIQRETGQDAAHGLVLVQIALKLDENTANTAAFI